MCRSRPADGTYFLFPAIHLGPYFHEINQGQWDYFMGPGNAAANFGPPPKKSQ